MYSTNLIFDIVLQARHWKWFFSINYYETSYKLFWTVFSKSRKKIQKFSNIDVLTTSQRKKLPSGNFKFLPEPEKIGRELIEKYNPEDKVGYIMKVDLVSTKIISWDRNWAIILLVWRKKHFKWQSDMKKELKLHLTAINSK